MSITFLIVNLLLWVLVAVLALTAAVRSKALFREGAKVNPQDLRLALDKAAVRQAEPDAVRNSDALRQQITSQLSAVTATLDGMLVDQPRRKILRSLRTEVAS